MTRTNYCGGKHALARPGGHSSPRGSVRELSLSPLSSTKIRTQKRLRCM
ncbi:hypothetical protein E2C01_086001 [Portunus trituberculatus]|uniref:Uncharacterized protein n=1 Tax=Portunus trituberculatus TaxID=210409 RepID=A0A5B7J946_PORTR|nr:hypothetical protein [Portunus trituberculatus]